MLGEEMNVQEQTRLWNEHSDGLWIVDPIDGTNNFVNGLPHFAVSVALVKNGHSELGVIYNPVSGRMFLCRTRQRRIPQRHTAAAAFRKQKT